MPRRGGGEVSCKAPAEKGLRGKEEQMRTETDV